MVKSARESSVWRNRKVLGCCMLIALANMQYGFDTASIGGLQAMPGFLAIYGFKDPKSPSGYSITTTVQQLISSLLTVGSVIGCLTTGYFGQKFGRRPALWVGCVISVIANSIQIASVNVAGLYAGRIILGISNAYFITFSNVFIAEIAPHHMRAALIAFFGVAVTMGTVIGNVVDNYTRVYQSKLAYQIPLACNYFVPLVLGIGLIFMPDSPRWLMLQNRVAEARQALVRFRGSSVPPHLVEEEFIEIQRGIQIEQEIGAGVNPMELFRGTNLRRTMIAWISVAAHSATGVFVLISFNTFFFQEAGITNPFQLSITSTVLGFAGACFGMFLMFKVLGRRPMMIGGAFFNGIFMLAIAIAYTVAPNSQSAGAALSAFAMLFQFSYNCGIGSVSYAVASEAVSSRLRAYSMGTATAWNFVFSWLTSFTSPYFINSVSSTYIGPKFCYIWAGSNFIAMVVFIFTIPELKGLTLEEIDECFANHVSTFKFKAYQCVTGLRAAEIAEMEKAGTEFVTENAEPQRV